MKLPADINNGISYIYKTTQPESVFLYGSHARGDFIKSSDYEVGFLYESDKRINREQIARMHSLQNINLYSFPIEEFTTHQIDIPFTKSIFYWDILEKGFVTLFGSPILEKMQKPHIMLSDILEELTFDKARSLGALLSFRNNDGVTANDHIIKSSFYASKMLILLQKNKFISRYDEITVHIQTCDLAQEYKDLVEYVFEIRNQKNKVELNKIFEIMSYINKAIFSPAKKLFEDKGNMIILS